MNVFAQVVFSYTSLVDKGLIGFFSCVDADLYIVLCKVLAFNEKRNAIEPFYTNFLKERKDCSGAYQSDLGGNSRTEHGEHCNNTFEIVTSVEQNIEMIDRKITSLR